MKVYVLGDFNINLFFEDHHFKRDRESHMKYRLLKPYIETFLAFGLNQLKEKPTRSTSGTASLIDHILTNSKGKVSHYGVISSGISDHDFIYCTRKRKCVKTEAYHHIY